MLSRSSDHWHNCLLLAVVMTLSEHLVIGE